MPVLAPHIIETELHKQSPQVSDEVRQQIHDRILWFIENQTPDFDLTLEVLQYNIAFFVQALLRNQKTLLRLDIPEQIYYPREERQMPLSKSQLVDIALRFLPIVTKLGLFVENLATIAWEFQESKKEILEALEKWNLIIMSNHASWMNLPIIAICLHLYCDIPQKGIYTILGPAITTRELSYSMINFSNLIKTVPDTPNGNILPEEVTRNIRSKMFETAKGIFRHEKGKVMLIAPSWTTDTFDATTWMLSLKKASKGTQIFLKFLWKKSPETENSFLSIGVNDKEVMPDNSRPQRGKVHLRIGKIFPGEKALDTLKGLPDLICDHQGKVVGEWNIE